MYAIRSYYGQASVSVSQCGYNTALDVLVAQVPAIMVPYAPPGENEQRRRADTLLRLGAIHSAPGAGIDLVQCLCALRITSYNVCYTKLLREQRCGRHGPRRTPSRQRAKTKRASAVRISSDSLV